MSELLVFENVSMVYSPGTTLEVKALKGVNFSLKENSFTYLLGPSGSGKTTLLNLAGLLDSPSEGRIMLDGRDVARAGESEKAKIRNKSIGFMFQQPTFLPEFTAFENVMMPSLIGGNPKYDSQKAVTKLFEKVNMGDRMHHFPPQLSGGELQRLTILRALINEPKIILCDEPTGQLDDDNAQIVLDALNEFSASSGAAILFVTHNNELVKSGSSVMKLRNGSLLSIKEGKS